MYNLWFTSIEITVSKVEELEGCFPTGIEKYLTEKLGFLKFTSSWRLTYLLIYIQYSEKK